MGVDWQFPIFSTIFLAAHIIAFGDVQRCSPAYNASITATSSVMFLLSFSALLAEFNYCKTCMDCLSIIFIFLLPIMFVASGTLLLVNKTYNCLPGIIVRLDVGLLIVTNFVIVLVFLLLMCWMISIMKERKKKLLARQELQSVYENIYKKDFDVNSFLQRYANALDSDGMDEKDLAILKDQFGYEFKEDQTAVSPEDKKVCAVCLGEFQPGDDVMDHPGCHHAFHFECISHWLKRKGFKCGCPLCKKATISTMIREIRTKQFGDVLPEEVLTAANPQEERPNILQNRQAQ